MSAVYRITLTLEINKNAEVVIITLFIQGPCSYEAGIQRGPILNIYKITFIIITVIFKRELKDM